MQKIKRRRWGAQAWRAMLARFADGGLSVRAFCERESVSTASFYRWRSQLGKVAKADAAERQLAVPRVQAGFVDLGPLIAPPSAPARFELRLDLGGGLLLQLLRD